MRTLFFICLVSVVLAVLFGGGPLAFLILPLAVAVAAEIIAVLRHGRPARRIAHQAVESYRVRYHRAVAHWSRPAWNASILTTRQKR